ncbi:hypothetical protein C8J57DRAFT_1649182 [Mycena rebaudengoi]|nr:hypothetical protein C8J57DRAFT_1649182 [Mycena rebaudengoi]
MGKVAWLDGKGHLPEENNNLQWPRMSFKVELNWMETSITPAFPADLERKIFELAANRHPETMPSLMLVAHRVLQWIEPLLYRILIFDLTFRPTIATSPVRLLKPTRWAKHVQVVLVLFPVDTLQSILPLCTGICKLALYYVHPPMLPVVEMLLLRELPVDFEDLFGTPTLPTIDPTLPMFRELTHLRVQNVSEECSFTEFPALTHLCFNAQVGGGALVASTLEHCSKLRILVGVFWGQRSIELWDQSTEDLRLVLMCTARKEEIIADRQAAVQGESGMWARAERYITKRRRGEIQPPSRCWIEDSDLIQ